MSIRKVKLKEGALKWEVITYTNGRGSKMLRRRFDKKVDAENFQVEFKSRANEVKSIGTGVKNFEETDFKTEAQSWLLIQGRKFSPGHLKRVTGILEELLPKYGRLAPNQFHPGFLSRLQTDMLNQESSPATVNRKTEVITAILNFSARSRRIPFSPAVGFEKLDEVREEMKFWEEDEALSFLNFADIKYPSGSESRWVFVVYLLALNSALRAGEIWGLQPQDCVEGGEVLFVRRQFDRVKKDFTPPKGKKSRRVPCNPLLQFEIESLIEVRKTIPTQTIFHGEDGRPLNHDSFSDHFVRDIKKWGGKRIRFHDLRHTATTLMILHGVNLKTVKEICGHKDISTTMGYSHLVEESVNKVARSFSIRPVEAKDVLPKMLPKSNSTKEIFG